MISVGAGARADRTAAACLGLVLFAIYAAGACRTIYVGDSGELVTAVAVLGIPHPSGYPLYVLLGKLWTLIVPVGSIALRMSLFSAACSAVAAVLVWRLGRAIGLRAPSALLGSLLFAFGPSFWAEANVQRVYGLGACFVVGALLLAWRWSLSGDLRHLALAFAVCGLGATNHTFMAVEAFALALFVPIAEPALIKRPLRLLAACAAFLPGLAVYLYLPLRSRANPRLDWGDPESFTAMLDVITRKGFWERRWIEGPGDLLPIGVDFVRGLAIETAWVGALLALVGVAAWFRGRVGTSGVAPPPARSRRFVLLLFLVMLGNLAALALHGSRSDIFIWHRYDIPSYAIMGILAGVGLEALLALLARIPRAFAWGALALPLVMLVTGWGAHDRSRYRIGEDYSETVLSSVTPGAHLIAEDDNILFTLMYLHIAEGRRADVDLILQGVGGEKLPPLRFDPDTDPLFFTHHPNWDLPGLSIVPVGLTFRAWRAGGPAPAALPLKEWLDGEHDSRVPKDYLTQNLIGQFHYMRGLTLMEADWPGARREFDRARAASPDNDVLFFNLGLIAERNGLWAEALEDYQRSRAINPRHIANNARSNVNDRIGAVEAEAERIAGIESRILAREHASAADTDRSGALHRELADRLEDLGEQTAARGHRLRATEAGRGSGSPPEAR